MKKVVSLILLFLMCFGITACAKTYTKIGSSEFSIAIPKGYVLSENELDEDQIGYYYKDDDSIDFDVYQWEKEGVYTLEEEAEYFASEYGTEPEKITINGIQGMKYVSSEEFDGYEYTVVNYMFEDDNYIIELSFWTIDTAEEYKAVDDIINTIKKN